MPHLTRQDRATLGEGRRRQILGAALRVFARRGFAAATIEEVARTAGVAEGTIYNYFDGKEDLLIHIPRHLAGPVFDRLAVQLAEADTAADAERVLVALARGLVARITGNVRFIKVFFSALPYLSVRARAEYMRLLPLTVAGILEEHLRRGMSRGLYRPDLEPAIAARALPGSLLMFALSQEVLVGRRIVPHSYDTITRETIRFFLRGILQHPLPEPSAGRRSH
jgi:AcrR family transcriptional regulator